MPGAFGWLGAAAAIALCCAATPALADFSACGSAYAAKDPQQQIDLYTICLKHGGLMAGDISGAFNNRGVAYMELHQPDQALQDFTASIQYDRTWGMAHLNRALIYSSRGQWALADADLTEALRDEPPEPRVFEYQTRAYVRGRQGRFREALADLDEALKRNHKSADLYNTAAWLLAACPDPSVRDGKRAIELAEAALKLADRPYIRDTLAAAYAEAGRYDDAVREQGKAIDMARAQSPGRDFPALEARLDLYRKGMAFHGAPVAAAAAH